jgi:uncharacterized protein YxjI
MRFCHTLIGALLLAIGCGEGNPNYSRQQPIKKNNSEQESAAKETPDYEKMLMSAAKITVSEYSVSIGKDYDILADGKKAAIVSGKNIRIIGGDVFTLTTLDGKVLASEKEHHRWISLNRAASIYDGQENLVGYFGEEKLSNLFSVHYVFHIYDKDKNEIGKSKKLTKSCLGTHTILDSSGNIDYDIDKKFVVLGGDKYVITVKDQNSEISRFAAIFMTCIEDAIADSND